VIQKSEARLVDKFETMILQERCGGCGAPLEPLVVVEGAANRLRPDAFFASSSHKLSSSLMACESCGLTQVGVLLDPSDLQAAYADATDDDHSKQFDHRRSSFARALQRSIFPYMSADERSPWLDVGTASGAFVAAARGLDIEAIGIEPSAYVVSQAPSGVRPYLRSGFIDDLDPSERFQVISYWDVLEHVADPRAEILAAKKHLAPGGFLVLNLPMIDTASARLLGRRWPFYLDVHLYYFTRQTVERFLTPLGFEVIAMNSYSQTLDLRYLLARYMRGRSPAAVLSRIPIRYWMGQRTIVARLAT
jgi:2-polyprenyl-3-methyl-5-hydroxy-6-metoxy-1,4-benzoquinol methylase